MLELEKDSKRSILLRCFVVVLFLRVHVDIRNVNEILWKYLTTVWSQSTRFPVALFTLLSCSLKAIRQPCNLSVFNKLSERVEQTSKESWTTAKYLNLYYARYYYFSFSSLTSFEVLHQLIPVTGINWSLDIMFISRIQLLFWRCLFEYKLV
jgi:hypothetical protein